jgi:hypothetical protein
VPILAESCLFAVFVAAYYHIGKSFDRCTAGRARRPGARDHRAVVDSISITLAVRGCDGAHGVRGVWWATIALGGFFLVAPRLAEGTHHDHNLTI